MKTLKFKIELEYEIDGEEPERNHAIASLNLAIEKSSIGVLWSATLDRENDDWELLLKECSIEEINDNPATIPTYQWRKRYPVVC